MNKRQGRKQCSTDVEEVHVQQKTSKKDAYYVALFDGSSLIITHVQLEENFKDNNYAECAKTIRLALRSKRKLGFIDGRIPKPENDLDKEEDWWEINTLVGSCSLNTIEPSLRSSINYSKRVKEL